MNAAPVQANVATPSSETPTPTTPVTPQNPNSFNSSVHKINSFNTSVPGQGGTGAPNVQPTQQPPTATVPPQMQQENQMPQAVFTTLNEDVSLGIFTAYYNEN